MTVFNSDPLDSAAAANRWSQAGDSPAERAMSPIAVLVLDGVISAALALGARAVGFGWGSAFLFGWAGGAVLTVGLLAAGCALSEAIKHRRARPVPTGTPSQARYAEWDADLDADRAAARRRARDAA